MALSNDAAFLLVSSFMCVRNDADNCRGKPKGERAKCHEYNDKDQISFEMAFVIIMVEGCILTDQDIIQWNGGCHLRCKCAVCS